MLNFSTMHQGIVALKKKPNERWIQIGELRAPKHSMVKGFFVTAGD